MNPDTGKLVVFSAPSGSGKTSIVEHLLQQEYLPLSFSVSATTRPRRKGEVDGRHYHFLDKTEFFRLRDEGAFLEWEEVYAGSYYGTLHQAIQDIWDRSKHVIFDIDVVGGLNIKAQYPERTLAIFVQPPNIATLRERLRARSTESEEIIEMRVAKAEKELKEAPKFDRIIVNDSLDDARREAIRLVADFLGIENNQ